MNEKILVAYASKYGATREIAGKIGDILNQEGFQVELRSAAEIQNPSDYMAVILGSAIYVGKWHSGATRFLKNYYQTLASLPVWFFSSGPTGHGDPVDLVEGICYPSTLKPLIERINPREVVVFHGNINKTKVNLIEEWAIKNLVKKPFGDFRDWDSISKWAASIALAMKTEIAGNLVSE